MGFDLTPVKFHRLHIKGAAEKLNTAIRFYFISYLKIMLLTIILPLY